MPAAAPPENEPQRLAAVRQTGLLDTAPSRNFDELVKLACQMFDVPIALVSLIDQQRQWFKAKCGLDVCGTSRDDSFCAHAILDNGVMVVNDATRDRRFRDNPLVTGEPYIRFYAGAPILSEYGLALGTVCLIDDKPRAFYEHEKTSLKMLANQAMDQVTLYRHTKNREKAGTQNKAASAPAKRIEDRLAQIGRILNEKRDAFDQQTLETFESLKAQLQASSAEGGGHASAPLFDQFEWAD